MLFPFFKSLFSKLLSSLQHVLFPFLFTSSLPPINYLSPLKWRVSTFHSAFTSTLGFLHSLCSATPCLWLGGPLAFAVLPSGSREAVSEQCRFLPTSSFPVSHPNPSPFQSKGWKNKVTNHFLDLGVYTWIPLWSWHLPFSFNLIHSSSLCRFRSEI